MNFQTADQLGRELAHFQCRQAGLISDEFCKSAGLLEGLLYAPLTAIAAMVAAPVGSRLRSMGLGLLLGAGMGAVSNREVAVRNAQGDPITRREMSPVMKAVLAGVALGGAQRVQQSQAAGRQISTAGAMLAGAPIGAMLSSDPATGMALGGISGSLISAMHRGQGGNPVQEIIQSVTGSPVSLPQAALQIHEQARRVAGPGPIPVARLVGPEAAASMIR